MRNELLLPKTVKYLFSESFQCYVVPLKIQDTQNQQIFVRITACSMKPFGIKSREALMQDWMVSIGQQEDEL